MVPAQNESTWDSQCSHRIHAQSDPLQPGAHNQTPIRNATTQGGNHKTAEIRRQCAGNFQPHISQMLNSAEIPDRLEGFSADCYIKMRQLLRAGEIKNDDSAPIHRRGLRR